MKFTAPYLLSNEDLEGVKASLHVMDTEITVEAEVKVFTLDQYRAIGKVDLDIGKGESDGLLVALVTAEFPDVEGDIPDEIYHTVYNIEYPIGETRHAPRHTKLCFCDREERYIRLYTDGTTVSVENYPEVVNLSMMPTLSEAIEKRVDAVTFGLCNPFIRCDVSKIKLIEIARDIEDSVTIKERCFKEYCRILNGIFRDYGSDAFESLKCISGTYSELNYFFKLFSNRKLECIWVIDDPARLQVKDLYTDFLCVEKSTDCTRPGMKYGKLLYCGWLPMRKIITLDRYRGFTCPNGDPHMKDELVDLRFCKVLNKLELEYNYAFEGERDPMDEDSTDEYSTDEDDTGTYFFVTLEFNRLKSPKSATFR